MKLTCYLGGHIQSPSGRVEDHLGCSAVASPELPSGLCASEQAFHFCLLVFCYFCLSLSIISRHLAHFTSPGIQQGCHTRLKSYVCRLCSYSCFRLDLNASPFGASLTLPGSLFQGSIVLLANERFLWSVRAYLTLSPSSLAICLVCNDAVF